MRSRPKKTPDFKVNLNGNTYLIEAKTLRDAPPVVPGKVSRCGKLNHLQKMKKVAHIAHDQLKSYDPENAYPWILWLHDRRQLPGHVTVNRLIGIFYGARPVVYAKAASEKVESGLLLHAADSFFWKRPKMAAVVLSGEFCPQMFVNEFGASEQFLAGSFPEIFEKQGSVVTPASLILRGAFTAKDKLGQNISRKELNNYLEEIYRIRGAQILEPMHAYEAIDLSWVNVTDPGNQVIP